MRGRISLAARIGWLSVALAWTVSARSAELSVIDLNTNPFLCDGQWHASAARAWRVTTDARVVGYQLWVGMALGAIADVQAVLRRDSDGVAIGHYSWDHYGDPIAPHAPVWWFPAGHQMTVRAGDVLRAAGTCLAFGSSPPGTHGHVLARVWYY